MNNNTKTFDEIFEAIDHIKSSIDSQHKMNENTYKLIAASFLFNLIFTCFMVYIVR